MLVITTYFELIIYELKNEIKNNGKNTMKLKLRKIISIIILLKKGVKEK